MLHNRQWYISQFDNTAKAAEQLKQYQDLCFGLRIGRFVLVNDSTDCGIIEYAVIDEEQSTQIDSWTIGWMGLNEVKRSLDTLLKETSCLEPFSTFNDFTPSMLINRPLN